MPTVREKNIYLDFPAGWPVVKYDKTTFYREKIVRQMQQVRGVDVVAYATDSAPPRLLLLEVKDYRVSPTSAEDKKVELRQTVLQKALNTLGGLYAAHRLHDAELGPVGRHLFHPALRIEVVLLLELPALIAQPRTTSQKLRKQNPQNALNDLRLELTSALNGLGLGFELRNSRTLLPEDGWLMRFGEPE